ncbi:MAG: site-specific DNA-methyltransferase [Gammaproteobacteria bacterium]
MPTLNWIGKQAVVKHHQEVPYRLLELVPELSLPVRSESTVRPEPFDHAQDRLRGPLGREVEGQEDFNGNLVVQGDNLHALKALLPRYAGQVKCIYIDPPYNTGNEGWIYNDNVNSPEIRKWLGEVVGREGETLDRHDRWLCMMYPRLVLLKQFLHEDGAIFVSIDDDEVHHLRTLMDEIFSINKRLATFVWRTDGNFDNQAKVKICHEYVLAYSIDPGKFSAPKVIDPTIGAKSKLRKETIRNTIVKNGPKNPISVVTLPVGFPADFKDGVIPARSNAWPHYESDVVVIDGLLGKSVVAQSGWSSKELLEEFVAAKFEPIKDSKGQSTRFVITKTGAIESIKDRKSPSHVISVIGGVGTTQSQSAELADMSTKFPFPKPVDLIKYLISMISGSDFVVLDSFAGSGTTGHAVLKQNAEDGGKRRFILVEMDDNIARNVTAERVKRVAQGYTNAKGEAVAGLGGGFQFCTLSQEPLFTAEGQIRGDVTFAQLAEFVWFRETGTGLFLNPSTGSGRTAFDSPLLGVYEGRAIYLLYNGILKDKSVNGGNVLTGKVLEVLPAFNGPKVIYAAACRLGEPRLRRQGIVFKQTPYALAV